MFGAYGRSRLKQRPEGAHYWCPTRKDDSARLCNGMRTEGVVGFPWGCGPRSLLPGRTLKPGRRRLDGARERAMAPISEGAGLPAPAV